MKIKVKIELLSGETGLKMPGSVLLMDKQKANMLEGKGIVSIVKPKKKRSKPTK